MNIKKIKEVNFFTHQEERGGIHFSDTDNKLYGFLFTFEVVVKWNKAFNLNDFGYLVFKVEGSELVNATFDYLNYSCLLNYSDYKSTYYKMPFWRITKKSRTLKFSMYVTFYDLINGSWNCYIVFELWRLYKQYSEATLTIRKLTK